MRTSLPIRIFSVHLLFMLALGVLGMLLIRSAFESYERRWKAELETLPAEKLFSPLASELARSLLLKLETGPSEPHEQVRTRVGEALDRVLPTLPGIDRLVILGPDRAVAYASDPAREARAEPLSDEDYKLSISAGLSKLVGALPMDSLIVVDGERRIQYVNNPSYVDLTFTGDEAALFDSEVPVRRATTLGSGEHGIEVMLPVFDRGGPSGGRRRLGSVLLQYRPDPGLEARLPDLRPPSVGPELYVRPLILFLVVGVGGGILLAFLTGLPVRRMERVLADFRARGYKGELDPQKVGLPEDLASTVRAISELGHQVQALDAQGREREALLETLSKSLEDGMLAVDPAGVPVAWNPAALRILTGRDDETAADFGWAAQTDAIRRALDRNPDIDLALCTTDGGNTREVEIVRPEGASMLARVTQVPFELRPGVTGALLLIRNLAALREVETHLLDAGRFAVLAHLAASLAHEIRNPLHAITINASVVEQYADPSRVDRVSQAVAESLFTIKDEAQRLTDLLDNYLGLVRSGEEQGPVDLQEVIRRVVQLVTYAASKAHVVVRVSGDPSPPSIFGSANRVQQAILNLVLNAIQAMPDGGTLTVDTCSTAEMVRVTVSDTGPGLPQELADRLFDTAVTTKPMGVGLGLPLVRIIAESHGGGVWYRSRPGEGASFTLALPTRVGS